MTPEEEAEFDRDYGESLEGQREARDTIIQAMDESPLSEAVGHMGTFFYSGASVYEKMGEKIGRLEAEPEENRVQIETGYRLLEQALDDSLMILQNVRQRVKAQNSSFSG